MKRGAPLQRKTPLQAKKPMGRAGRPKPKRATPRRREAARWTAEDWLAANVVLKVRCAGRCEKCMADLTKTGVERHHRKRRRDGGDRLENIAMLCPGCHQWITEHPAEARRRGWIVAVTAEPTEVPFWTKSGWVLFTDDGRYVWPELAMDADAHDL